MHTHTQSRLLVALTCTAASAFSVEWSDTSIGWRYGVNFREPYNDENIKKNIVNFTHANGYFLGSNFLNIDALFSDRNDPARSASGPSSEGATEIYALYRHTLDIGKVCSTSLAMGPIRGIGLVGGADINLKNDQGYGSSKRMLVVGPKAMVDVPGFFDVSVVMLYESNKPTAIKDRYHYQPHPALNTAWGIPFTVGHAALTWGGYANVIASKGDDEFGAATAPEIHVDTQLLVDTATLIGAPPRGFRAGVALEYWRNKFGNDPDVVGSHAFTPMVRAEYHF